MDEQTTILRFRVPGPDSPGYLARVRQSLEFRRSLVGEPTPEMLDKMVEFLAEYVIEPVGRQERIDALYNASQNEFEQLLGALTGETSGNPTP